MAKFFESGLDEAYEKRVAARIAHLLDEVAEEACHVTKTSFKVELKQFLCTYDLILSFRRMDGEYLFSGRMVVEHPKCLTWAGIAEISYFCYELAQALGGFERNHMVTVGEEFTEWVRFAYSADPVQEVDALVLAFYEAADTYAENADCFLQRYKQRASQPQAGHEVDIAV